MHGSNGLVKRTHFPLVRGPALVAFFVCLATGTASHAQVSVDIHLQQGANGTLDPVALPPATAVHVYDCLRLPVPLTYGVGTFDFRYNPDDNWDVSLTSKFTSTPTEALVVICGLFPAVCPISLIDSCGPQIVERTDYHELHGGVGLYVVQGGGGIGGGESYTRIATGTITMNDMLEITVPAAMDLELPLTAVGSLEGAESFGDPDQTWGKASLGISGNIAGEPIDLSGNVESESVIPTQLSLDASRTVSLSVPSGVSLYPINLIAQARVEVKATSAGLFGTIVGSATASVSFPNSLHIGRLRAAGGGPLPAGVRVRGLLTGVTYEDPSATCYANCDGSTGTPALNVNDFICFQSKFAAGDPYANCDGSTAAPVLNVSDFICFQSAFAAGCP